MARPGIVSRLRLGLILFVVLSTLIVYWAVGRLASSPRRIGLEAYERKDWGTASRLAGERLRAAPNDPDALTLLARATFRLGRDEDARALYRKLNPGSFQAEDYYLLGLAMRRAGDPEVALSCWEAGRDADASRADILWELAQVYLHLSRYYKASGVAAILAARKGWEARSALIEAQARLGLGEPDAAADSLSKALTVDPDAGGAPEPAAHYRKLLARAYLLAGRSPLARLRLQEVLAAGPDAEASWLLSRAALQEGAWREARAAQQAGRSYRDSHPMEPEPGPHVGAARCARCHRTIHDAQQSSRHALTFQRAADLPDRLLPDQPVPDRYNANVIHKFARDDGQLRFETRQPDKVLEAVVEFAFGSGDRGLTLVGRDEQGHARECRLSRYAEVHGWDVTTGQPADPPASEAYLGRVLSPDFARLCLDCHTTRARAARDRTGPEAADRGIGCERCHGPGGHHVRAVEAEFPDLAIARPRAVAGGRSIHLCQQCHRSPGAKIERTDPKAVRFAATSLKWSSCYSATGGALDCVTCHDPHHNAEIEPGHYEAKCLSCHAGADSPATRGDASARSAHAPVCPVKPRDGCIACHMPAVTGEIPHSTFTDHYIRIRHAPGTNR